MDGPRATSYSADRSGDEAQILGYRPREHRRPLELLAGPNDSLPIDREAGAAKVFTDVMSVASTMDRPGLVDLLALRPPSATRSRSWTWSTSIGWVARSANCSEARALIDCFEDRSDRPCSSLEPENPTHGSDRNRRVDLSTWLQRAPLPDIRMRRLISETAIVGRDCRGRRREGQAAPGASYENDMVPRVEANRNLDIASRSADLAHGGRPSNLGSGVVHLVASQRDAFGLGISRRPRPPIQGWPGSRRGE